MKLLLILTSVSIFGIHLSLGIQCFTCIGDSTQGICNQTDEYNQYLMKVVDCPKGTTGCAKRVLKGFKDSDTLISKRCSPAPNTLGYTNEFDNSCSSTGPRIEHILRAFNNLNPNTYKELTLCDCSSDLCNSGHNLILSIELVVVALGVCAILLS